MSQYVDGTEPHISSICSGCQQAVTLNNSLDDNAYFGACPACGRNIRVEHQPHPGFAGAASGADKMLDLMVADARKAQLRAEAANAPKPKDQIRGYDVETGDDGNTYAFTALPELGTFKTDDSEHAASKAANALNAYLAAKSAEPEPEPEPTVETPPVDMSETNEFREGA